MCMVGRVGWRGEAGQRIGYREGSRGMEEQRVLVQVVSVAMYEMRVWKRCSVREDTNGAKGHIHGPPGRYIHVRADTYTDLRR